MPSQGPLSPSSFAQGTGSGTWSNLSNIAASDDNRATMTESALGDKSPIFAGNFGFNIPSTAVIEGVQVEAEFSASSSGIILTNTWLRYNDATLGSVDTTNSPQFPPTSFEGEYYSRGGESSLWGAVLTPAIINHSTFQIAVQTNHATSASRTVNCDHVRVTVWYRENTAPTITFTPSVSYGSLTRTGPSNTPAVVSFTATDAEETGAGELDYEIRTATGGGGTLVASGTCTSGANQNVNIAHNASGINEGSNTLYLVVSDGTDDDEESFTLLVDRTAPSVGAVTTTPTTVRP